MNIVLKNAGANKVKVIKIVCEVTGMGLGEAKDIVDGVEAGNEYTITVRGDSSTIDSIYCDGVDVSWMETILLVSIYERNGVSW